MKYGQNSKKISKVLIIFLKLFLKLGGSGQCGSLFIFFKAFLSVLYS